MSARGLALGVALLASGCGGDALVVVHAEQAAGLDLAPASLVAQLTASATASGARRVSAPVTFGPKGAAVVTLPATFGLDVPSAEAGDFALRVDAVARDGSTLATANGTGVATAGARTDVTVVFGGAAALPDGGAPDEGPPDAAKAPSGCPATSTALLCEDFEAGLDTQRWTVVEVNGGTASLDTIHVHGGKAALVASTSATGSTVATIRNTSALRTVHNGFYVRAFLQVFDTAPPLTSNLVTAVQTSGAFGGIALDHVDSNNHNAALSGWAQFSSAGYVIENNGADGLLTHDVWHCVEVLFLGATSNGGETRVWIDGTEVPDFHAVGLPRDDLGALAFGLDVGSGTFAKAHVAVDDIVVDTQRIGCK